AIQYLHTFMIWVGQPVYGWKSTEWMPKSSSSPAHVALGSDRFSQGEGTLDKMEGSFRRWDSTKEG
ncbi:hypothetical protein AVEN_205664-1, partial [Araneus ventricosus]